MWYLKGIWYKEKIEFLEKALNSYALKDKIYNKIKGDVMIFTGMLVVVAIIGIIYNMLKNKEVISNYKGFIIPDKQEN